MSDACTACETPLPADRAKCAKCGKVDLERARALNRAGAEAVRRAHGAVGAARVLLYGSLAAALAVLGIEAAVPGGSGPWRAAAEQALFGLVAVAGLSSLGPGSFLASLGGRVRPAHFLPTVVTGLAAGLLWWGWDLLVSRTLGGEPDRLDTALLVSVFLLAVVQEYLSRGATWAALSRFSSPGKANLVAAAQFAVVYGIAWFPLSVPARFGIGFLFGRLRLRTGSLAPCLAAHLLAQGLALALPT